MSRLTERHYVEKDGYYLKCSGEPSCPENCEECNRLDDAIDRLGEYEDTGLPPKVCADYKTFEDECISKGVTFSRIVELMNADAEGRLKIVPRAPKGTVCGSCVHFERENGTAHGFCKTQTQMRMSAEFPSGKIEPRYVVESICGYTRLRELAEADKEGRVAVLPCEVGGSMLNTIDIERPRIMKGLHFAVAYESIRGTIFYIPYDIFRKYIDAGHVQPLHKLKEVQNG